MGENKLNTFYAPADKLPINEIESQYEKIAYNEFFVKVINSINVLILIVNEYRQIIFANENYLKMIHSDSLQTILGEKLGESLNCIHSYDNSLGCGTSEACRNCSALNILLHASKSGVEQEGEGSIIIGEDGFDKAINLFEKVVPINVENERYYIISFIDATDFVIRKSMERVFFHDILNTTGALRGILRLLKDQIPSNYEDEVEEVENLFDGLVDEIVSQKQMLAAETNDLSSNMSQFSSLEVLHSAKKLFQIYGDSFSKTIEIDDDSINMVMVGDLTLLKRVLGNMIKNALEATKPNGIVYIGCCKLDDNYIKYWVKNDNFIPEEIQNNIFKRSFSTKGEGRGLGTYSMKLLGEKYLNGVVGFKTFKTIGTEFYINVPVLKNKFGGVRMRILIAEDDLASRIFMKKFLSMYGECDVVVDGIEAIDAYLNALNENRSYDLICLDIMMPRLDGLKALKSIRDIEKQKGIEGEGRVKIIMTTALNDKATVYNAYDSGCEAYAWKPIETEKFIEVMKRLGLLED